MIKIPGGSFFMGSDDDLPFEKPAHQVRLTRYCMDKFEVTVAEYKACSDSGQCKRAPVNNEWEGISEKERKAFDPLCNIRDPEDHAKHPINCVDFEMAAKFCQEQGKRLPTEAEWEFAARGPDGRKYPWGDETPGLGHMNACGKECVAWGKKAGIDDMKPMYEEDDGYAATAPVGSFPKGASRYGLEDVVGNVWEWVSDFYAPYTKDEQTDPKGPDTGADKVIRGGAWNASYPAWVRPTFRYHDVPTKRSYGIGFRCAKGD
jgi:formylglycine-generating enzyme required for sulfatase activity